MLSEATTPVPSCSSCTCLSQWQWSLQTPPCQGVLGTCTAVAVGWVSGCVTH